MTAQKNTPTHIASRSTNRRRNETSYLLATRWSRFFAHFIDVFIMLIATLPTLWMLGGYKKLIATDFELTTEQLIALTLYEFLAFFFIHGYLLYHYGQTVGKSLLGIYIAEYGSSQKADFLTIIFKRFLPVTLVYSLLEIGQFLILIDYLFIFREDQRCIHDHIAGTHVLQVPER